MQNNLACKKVSAASKQNQEADSGLCNVALHINRLRKNRARFLHIAEVLVRNVLVSVKACNKTVRKKESRSILAFSLCYSPK